MRHLIMEQWQMQFAVPLNQPEPEKSTLNSDAKARSFQLEENRCVVFLGEPQTLNLNQKGILKEKLAPNIVPVSKSPPEW